MDESRPIFDGVRFQKFGKVYGREGKDTIVGGKGQSFRREGLQGAVREEGRQEFSGRAKTEGFAWRFRSVKTEPARASGADAVLMHAYHHQVK